MCDVSIIIVNYNARRYLLECVSSVLRESSGFTFEIIPVDNGSVDDSVAVFKKEFPAIRPVTINPNRGFAAACNAGINASKGRYVLILGSDTIVLNNGIKKLFDFMESHPEAGMAGAKLFNGNRELACPSYDYFPDFFTSAVNSFRLFSLFKHSPHYRQVTLMEALRQSSFCPVDYVCGSCMFTRRKTIDSVGLLDEDYYLYFEETDWQKRMQNARWKIY